MISDNLFDAALHQVRPIDVQNYVRAMGWTRVEGIRGERSVYRKSTTDIEVIVPRNPAHLDYERRLTEAFLALSEAEGQSPDDILQQILLFPNDVLRFRIDGPDAADGAISLEESIKLILGLKEMLLAAACDVLHPQPYHANLDQREARNFVNNCRMGQTQRGSFVLSIICPFNVEALTLSREGKREPFTRRVTRRIMMAANQIVQAIADDNLERLVDSSNDTLVSGNFYRALASLQPEDRNTNVEILSSWTPAVATSAPFLSQVQLKNEYFPIIEQTALQLWPTPANKSGFFIGRIDSLSGKLGSDNRMQGMVEGGFLSEDTVVKVQLELSAEDYELACDAHKMGLFVSVKGTLDLDPGSPYMRDYKDFGVLKSKP